MPYEGLFHTEQEPSQSGTVQKTQWPAIGVKVLGYCCFCIRRNKAEKTSSADYRGVRPAVLSRVQACPEERRLPGCPGQWSCTPSPEHRTHAQTEPHKRVLQRKRTEGCALLISCPLPSHPVLGLWVEVHQGLRQKRPALTSGSLVREGWPRTSEDHKFFSQWDKNQRNYCDKFLVTQSKYSYG